MDGFWDAWRSRRAGSSGEMAGLVGEGWYLAGMQIRLSLSQVQVPGSSSFAAYGGDCYCKVLAEFWVAVG